MCNQFSNRKQAYQHAIIRYFGKCTIIIINIKYISENHFKNFQHLLLDSLIVHLEELR